MQAHCSTYGSLSLRSGSKGPVINSPRRGGERHLGGTKILHIESEGDEKKSISREVLWSFF